VEIENASILSDKAKMETAILEAVNK